jgi:hypothetical protein
MNALACEVFRYLVGHFAHAFLDGRATDQDFQLFLSSDYWHFLARSVEERLL